MSTLYVTFHSVSSALLLQELLAQQDICRIVPVPRSLSSSCGYAAEVKMEEPALQSLLAGDDTMEWDAIYLLTAENDFQLLLSHPS